ncbi:hypothetical protein TOPH_00167 [Tolypocladium ophioglossoides CBS 100239]|uniref:Secondary alcohol dehydrogenase n=1 Tax=Tolypocladium ophioglossoides (strain CBS 100239) TaxID=1163406 RepID=A0A0L0NLH3_TOLOC|nr:hypothetical protein TOPH_00167 [Tolypocladium ophioglossoides CBS 100239]
MSADTRPIAPSRFAAALKDLSIGMLHLKVLEIRNSIAHLQYSNDQLKPFAEGSATAVDSPSSSNAAEPDRDCVDAIRENEQVIDRMAERIALVRAEVEDRGMSWAEFQSNDEAAEAARKEEAERVNGDSDGDGDGDGETAPQHSAWTDGTFQTGTIRDGQVHLNSQPGRPSANGGAGVAAGGSLSDEQLRRALEEQMRNLGNDDGGDGGMHL